MFPVILLFGIGYIAGNEKMQKLIDKGVSNLYTSLSKKGEENENDISTEIPKQEPKL